MNYLTRAFLILLITFVARGCSKYEDVSVLDDDTTMSVVIDDGDFIASDWTTETHSKDGEPNFDEVFEDNTVKRLDIVIRADRWQTMLTDLTNIYGEFGSRGSSGFSDTDPIFVPGEVFYEGKEWYRVGIRFKGNSSLQSTWQAGNMKLSFKLDFDEFEDDYLQIDNQRFYGFKKLSLKNNYDDKSMIREKVAADIFREFGLASSHVALYTVYVDHGSGPQYFGVYSLVEEVDDTVIETQFADGSGNLYKPDGDAAAFTAGSYNEDEYVKKSNEDQANFTDVAQFLTALHDGSRTSNPSEWRTKLEATFDVDTYLKYLAVNEVIQNWDTYGRMTHNYFLYNNPVTNQLTWIPWDNNEAFQEGKMGGALWLDFYNIYAGYWPIIE